VKSKQEVALLKKQQDEVLSNREKLNKEKENEQYLQVLRMFAKEVCYLLINRVNLPLLKFT